MTASTSGCAQSRSSTSGIVSRVSPPARSIGLPRLQRAGTRASIASRIESGRSIQFESFRGTCVRRQHAPSADRGKDHGSATVRKRLRRERRRPLESLFDRRRAQDAELATQAVEDPIVTGERARVTRGCLLTLRTRTALDEHQRLLRGQSLRGPAKTTAHPRCPRRRSARHRYPGRPRNIRASPRDPSAQNCRERPPC